jgi:glyoxylase-like metal-dependent hydrolase (beta-lactamase superfamily II)
MVRGMEPRVVRAGNRGPFTLDGTRTYLVGRRRVAVVDPGPDEEDHVRALSRALEGAREIRILLTHRHPDHSGAAGPLFRLLEGRSPALSTLLVLGGGPSLRQGHGQSLSRLGEGDAIPTDQGTLVALETPGHTRDHLAFHWVDARAVFVGDLVLGRGDTTWVGEYPGCVEDYLASLGKVRELAPRVLYPSHGPPLTRPSEVLERFGGHRLQRVDDVRRASSLHPGAGPLELAKLVYGDAVPPGMMKAALASVEVILHHLRGRS